MSKRQACVTHIMNTDAWKRCQEKHVVCDMSGASLCIMAAHPSSDSQIAKNQSSKIESKSSK